jgi:hypothetical protein
MTFRTTVALPDDVAAAWKASGRTLPDLIRRGLDANMATDRQTIATLERQLAEVERAPRPSAATVPARRPAESPAAAAPRPSASSAPTATPTPRQVTYSRIRSALGERAGDPFTASAVAESLGITHHLAVGRLRYLGQLGMAECLGRTAGQGNPYAYRLTQVGQRRLCTEAQCDHAHHRNDQIPA